MKGSARRTPMLAAYGVIRGGAHDGWGYAFKRFLVDARGVLRIELIGCEPAWPFPRDLQLSRTQFNRLEGVKGARAPRIDTDPLIREALAIGPAPAPTRAARLARVREKYTAPRCA